ncbi:MAG: hypothetical protein BGO49_28520 [Planctomycetales bacterium 71-10]|nr:MAG: hypothetical protein BGO49_28520 [Planctomycetales bacterium 71-10]
MSNQIKKFPVRYNDEIASFKGIEVGDKFLRNDSAWDEVPSLVACTKVTAKQCVIGGKTYRIEDARELGRSNQWSRLGRPMNYTPEAHEAAKRAMRLRFRRSKLERMNWSKVPEDKIEAVWAVVGELADPPKEST